jgi:hypothetical protein
MAIDDVSVTVPAAVLDAIEVQAHAQPTSGGGATISVALPPGFEEGGLVDAKGRWVPKRLIKPVDMQRHELVVELAEAAKRMHAVLAAFKAKALSDVQAFCELSGEQYGVKQGGAKGNITLTSYDGRYRVQRAVNDCLVFDERLQVAKKLIDECINEWATGSRDEIRAIVQLAFQVDKQGKVSTEKILSLRKLDITHAKWANAMQAISDSIQVAATRAYVRIYERETDSDKYNAVELDLSKV